MSLNMGIMQLSMSPSIVRVMLRFLEDFRPKEVVLSQEFVHFLWTKCFVFIRKMSKLVQLLQMTCGWPNP